MTDGPRLRLTVDAVPGYEDIAWTFLREAVEECPNCKRIMVRPPNGCVFVVLRNKREWSIRQVKIKGGYRYENQDRD